MSQYLPTADSVNAVWAVLHQFGGASRPGNSGPGDRFEELKPVRLP